MTTLRNFVVVLIAVAFGTTSSGCGDDSSGDVVDGGGDAGADTDTDADTDADSDADAFDPENPGVNLMLELGSTYMMNQSIELAVGSFMITAREDFDEEAADTIPLDTCVVLTSEAAVPECTSDTDCAPEQNCLPEYDDSGAAIEGSESCTTPREPLDMGPFTVEGFTTGSVELSYNAGQNGAYTAAGSDGTLTAGTLAYDTTYTFAGDGDPAQGLGPFTGELYMAPEFELTSPPLVAMAMEGMYGIEASTAAELSLAWSGADAGGELTITVAGGQSDGSSVVCRVADDGAFTVPAEMMASSGLGAMAFLNMITFDRRSPGTASGDGLTFVAVEALQTTAINIIKTN